MNKVRLYVFAYKTCTERKVIQNNEQFSVQKANKI